MARLPDGPPPARAPRRAVPAVPSPSWRARVGEGALAGVGMVLGGLARVVARRPVPVVVGLVLATGAVCVGWNALMLQTRKHPAPLFAGRPEPVRVEPPRRAMPPVPAAASVPAAPAPAAVQPPAPLAEIPLPMPRPPATAPDVPVRTGSTRGGAGERAVAGDPIGILIRTGQPPRGDAAAADLPHGADPRRIAAAQTALTKLGYGPLQSDGLLGPGTLAALARFERDRRLPVGQILPARTARVLAQASGIRVE